MINDQPTPLSGENALLNAIWHSLESVPLGAVTDALPAIVAELRDYGYQIVRQAGMVTIPLDVAQSVGEILDLLDPDDMSDHVAQSIERFHAAIAAAQPTDAGEGDG